MTLGGSYSLTGLTQVSGGAADFNSTSSAGNLTLSAGTLAATGLLTVNGATTWSGGSLSIAGAGRVRLAGGSGATFGGTATVAPGDTLELAGGTFTLTGNLSVTGGGALAVTGGTLVLNGFTAALAGGFATAGTGALKMTLAGDSLAVGGAATFGGGSQHALGRCDHRRRRLQPDDERDRLRGHRDPSDHLDRGGERRTSRSPIRPRASSGDWSSRRSRTTSCSRRARRSPTR